MLPYNDLIHYFNNITENKNPNNLVSYYIPNLSNTFVDLLIYNICYKIYINDIFEMYPRTGNSYEYFLEVDKIIKNNNDLKCKTMIINNDIPFVKLNFYKQLHKYYHGYEFEFFTNTYNNGYYSGDTEAEGCLMEQETSKKYINRLINTYNNKHELLLLVYEHVLNILYHAYQTRKSTKFPFNEQLFEEIKDYIYHLIIIENTKLNIEFKSIGCSREYCIEEPYSVNFCRLIYKLYFDRDFDYIKKLLDKDEVISLLLRKVKFSLFAHDQILTRQFVLLKPLLFISIIENQLEFSNYIWNFSGYMCTKEYFRAMMSNVLGFDDYKDSLPNIYQETNNYFFFKELNEPVKQYFQKLYNENNKDLLKCGSKKHIKEFHNILGNFYRKKFKNVKEK